MRITVSHNKPKDEVVKSVDRSFDDFVRGLGFLPLQIVDEQRKWEGTTLRFTFTAKMGIISTPVNGFVEVTDQDVTLDANLGLLEKLLAGKEGRKTVETKIRGLLT